MHKQKLKNIFKHNSKRDTQCSSTYNCQSKPSPTCWPGRFSGKVQSPISQSQDCKRGKNSGKRNQYYCDCWISNCHSTYLEQVSGTYHSKVEQEKYPELGHDKIGRRFSQKYGANTM